MVVPIPKANVQLKEKFIMFTIKRTISEFSSHTLIKDLIVKTPYTSNKTKMKTLIGQ